MSIKLIHELHAAISRRDWTATEAAANSLRDDIDAIVKVLAGTNIGSMPNDYPISRLASDVELDRRERVRQCDLMAKDWADFCEAMSAKWDTQEAVAHELKARFNFLTALIEPMEGIEHFQDALDFRNDNLSKALRQWIEAGVSALHKIKASQHSNAIAKAGA